LWKSQLNEATLTTFTQIAYFAAARTLGAGNDMFAIVSNMIPWPENVVQGAAYFRNVVPRNQQLAIVSAKTARFPAHRLALYSKNANIDNDLTTHLSSVPPLFDANSRGNEGLPGKSPQGYRPVGFLFFHPVLDRTYR